MTSYGFFTEDGARRAAERILGRAGYRFLVQFDDAEAEWQVAYEWQRGTWALLKRGGRK